MVNYKASLRRSRTEKRARGSWKRLNEDFIVPWIVINEAVRTCFHVASVRKMNEVSVIRTG